MSIKDNIKEELLKLINERIERQEQNRKDVVDIMQYDEEWNEGYLCAVESELSFLKKHKKFIESI